MKLLLNLEEGSRLGDFLVGELDSDARSFSAATAFLRRSGIRHLRTPLERFSAERSTRVVVGVDLQGTSLEALEMLRESMGAQGRAYIFHNPVGRTFHPKLFSFDHEEKSEVYVGSGNLTGGGLHTNHEAGVLLSLDHADERAKRLAGEIEQAFDAWCDLDAPTTIALTEETIRSLLETGLIQAERTLIGLARGGNRGVGEAPALFVGIRAPRPPALVEDEAVDAAEMVTLAIEAEPGDAPALDSPRFYAMTLQRTDVGVGQTTQGASRRSPEIFIPLAARDQQPTFWGWQDAFTEDAAKPGKFDRSEVPFYIGGQTARVNMMTWPDKSDFRLRSEVLRSSGNVGDILVLERSADTPPSYFAEVIPQGSARHSDYLARCDQSVQNSARRFGYF